MVLIYNPGMHNSVSWGFLLHKKFFIFCEHIKMRSRLTHTPWDTLRRKPPPGFDLLYSLELSAIVTSIAHSACWNIALLTMKVAAILTLNGTLTSASYRCTSPNSTSRRKMAFCAMVSSKAESTSQKNHAKS